MLIWRCDEKGLGFGFPAVSASAEAGSDGHLMIIISSAGVPKAAAFF
jgi:hypothetical protein